MIGRGVMSKIPAHLRSVAQEWDQIGPLRHRLICEGRDPSFDQILVPYILKSLGLISGLRILDAGCGTGDLAARVAARGFPIWGVDISERSIFLANSSNSGSNIQYFHDSIERFCSINTNSFDGCIANMTFMDTPNLGDTLTAIRSGLLTGGILCMTILHPIFYTYFLSRTSGLDYLSETKILKEFRTTFYKHSRMYRTHWHRPLGFYVRRMIRSGFQIVSVDELAPPKSLQQSYGPLGRYPRFLGAIARAI